MIRKTRLGSSQIRNGGSEPSDAAVTESSNPYIKATKESLQLSEQMASRIGSQKIESADNKSKKQPAKRKWYFAQPVTKYVSKTGC